ncbi:MAG: hypothetical protein ACOY3P_24380 [Planctomycetota bacterium]
MKKVLLTLFCGLCTATGSGWAAEAPADVFVKGEQALGQGQFETALVAFASAARGDRSNQEYLQHYIITRRIIDLRKSVAAERDPLRWEQSARALHAFYTSEQIYLEALAIDEQLHARLQTSETAMMLAETQLAMGQNSAAAETLASLEENATTATSALYGVALARQGETSKAQEIAKSLTVSATAGAGERYAAARLLAQTGDAKQAAGLLQTVFESIPPSVQPSVRAHARACPDFASIASTDAFATALNAVSKVPESKCSGGSSCASCPMAGKCAASQAK